MKKKLSFIYFLFNFTSRKKIIIYLLSIQHLYISHQHSQQSHILVQFTFRNQIPQETMTFFWRNKQSNHYQLHISFNFSK